MMPAPWSKDSGPRTRKRHPSGLQRLAAAGGAAAGLDLGRLCGADEGAEKFAVDLRGDGVDVEALTGKKFTGIFDFINARGLDFGRGKPGALEFAEIIAFFERTRDAPDPEQNALANFGRHFAAGHD